MKDHNRYVLGFVGFGITLGSILWYDVFAFFGFDKTISIIGMVSVMLIGALITWLFVMKDKPLCKESVK